MACKLLAWIPGSTSLGLGCTAVTFLGGFEAKRLSAAAKATWLPRKAGLKSSGMCKLFSCQETEFPPLKWWDRVLELHLRVLNSKEGCSFSNSLRVPWNTNTEGGGYLRTPRFYLGEHPGGPQGRSKCLYSRCPGVTFDLALGWPRGLLEAAVDPYRFCCCGKDECLLWKASASCKSISYSVNCVWLFETPWTVVC